MTPMLQLRFNALSPGKQESVLPILEDLITSLENEGAAMILADPHADGRASMLVVGDVHFIYQLLQAGVEAYAGMLAKPEHIQ